MVATFNIERAIFISIITVIALSQGCSNHPEGAPYKALTPAPSTVSSSACIDVEGIVLGDITSNSKVSLYKTSSLNFTIVMSKIRTAQPVSWEIVNESGGFRFNCLSHGTYAFVIPTSSYKSSVGSPLPYEFDCRNFCLRIAFQGGDPRYAVGAFSIRDPTAQNRSTFARNSLSCDTLRGSLYKKCPLGLG